MRKVECFYGSKSIIDGLSKGFKSTVNLRGLLLVIAVSWSIVFYDIGKKNKQLIFPHTMVSVYTDINVKENKIYQT